MGIETIFILATVAAAGVSAYSSYQQGKAAEKTAKYNSKVAAVNQQTSQNQADADATRLREKYRRIRGSQTAAAAASGLDRSGSFSDLLTDTNMQEDLEIMQTLYQSKAMITGLEQRSQLGLMEGKQARNAGNLAAAGSLLSGTASAISSYPTVAANSSSTAYPTIVG